MNTKHTSGNWEAIGNLVRTSLTEGGFLVAECRDRDGQPHSDEAKRYARLVAAAPELLEALIALRKAELEDDSSDVSIALLRDMADAAITKATGASHVSQQ